MDALRVAVIGYGYWGPNLARTLNELPSTQLVAIADLKSEQLERAKGRYPGIILVTDYCELFKMGLDAVAIATPPKSHFHIAKDCLLHDLHILVEKPITLNSADAEELIQLADDRGLTLMVGHTFEFNPAVKAIKQYIESNELGDIYYIDTARLNLGLFQRDSNVLWDLAPHDISIILHLLGNNPVSVSAQGMPCVIPGVYDVAYLCLNFPNRITAYVHVSWLDPCKVRRVTVVGSKKMAVFNDLESDGKVKIYDKGVDAPAYTDSFGEFQYNYRYGDIVIPRIRYTEPLLQECEHFAESILNHTEPISSGRSGFRVLKVFGGGPAFHDKKLDTGTDPMVNADFSRIAPDVKLGRGVVVYAFVNLYGCEIGDDTKIGAFVEIQKGARIGNLVKVSSHTFICEGVTIEDEVFVGHGVMFINDKYPRAAGSAGQLQTEADWNCIPTLVKRGVSIGSNATILCGVTIGERAIVGAGSVVTKDVPAGAIVAGNPARVIRILGQELGDNS